jgi:hypothetical protein
MHIVQELQESLNRGLNPEELEMVTKVTSNHDKLVDLRVIVKCAKAEVLKGHQYMATRRAVEAAVKRTLTLEERDLVSGICRSQVNIEQVSTPTNNAGKKQVPCQLFERFFIAGRKCPDSMYSAVHSLLHVRVQQPPEAMFCCPSNADCRGEMMFCIPSSAMQKPEYVYLDRAFVFRISDGLEVSYGICVLIDIERGGDIASRAYCFVTRFPFFDFFFSIIEECLEVVRSTGRGPSLEGCDDEERSFFTDVTSRLQSVKVPLPGGSISFCVESGRKSIAFRRPQRFTSIHDNWEDMGAVEPRRRSISLLLEELGSRNSEVGGEATQHELLASRRTQRQLLAGMLSITEAQPPSCAVASFAIPVIYDVVDEEGLMLQNHALPNLLKLFPIADLLVVLGCALAEMKIVFVSSSLTNLSTCALGLQALLRPLCWDGLLIPILPPDPRLEGVVHCMQPLIVGMQRLPDDFEVLPNLAVIYVDRGGKVKFNEEESWRYHTVKFPMLDAIAHELAESSARQLQRREEMLTASDEVCTDAVKLAQDACDAAIVFRRIFDQIQTICEAALRIDVEETELFNGADRDSTWSEAALQIRMNCDPDNRIEAGVEGFEYGQAAAASAALKRFGRTGLSNANKALGWVTAVGMSGLPFMDRFRKTQMYSNYRDNLVR